MKNILFSHSYFLKLDPKQWKTGQPYAPLGTLYAAAFLRENGYNAVVHDTMFADGPDEIICSLKKHRPQYFVLYDDGFNYLTKMCLTNMREAAFRMITLAKDNGCTVIVSGSDSTDHFREYLDRGADFVIMGEAELTLLELTRSIDAGETKPAVNGVAFKEEGDYKTMPPRTVLRDLDSLPFPAWDLVDMEPYRKMWMKHAGYFSMNVATTRGCPFKCNWCAKPIYGNRYHARSPQNVVTELIMLKEKYGFDHIWFCDDIFGLKPGWVNEFARLTEKSGLLFRFRIQSRADLLLQENYILSLAKAGCENVWMGAESGSQKILDAMDKGTTVDQISQATALLKKYHIKPCFFIQFGYLHETKEDIDLTIQMISRLLPHDIGISVSYPLPGTGFYEKVKAEMKEKTNWTDSDDLALLFRNTFQPKYYKRLHRYVHKHFRLRMALVQLYSLLRHPLAVDRRALKKILSAFYYLPAACIEKFRLHQLEKLS